MKKYVKTHEWIEEQQEGIYAIGLTDHAQSELGDIVFVDLPKSGDTIKVGEPFAVVESVKAVSEVYAPVSGLITRVNDELIDQPGKINEAAGEVWLVLVSEVTAITELLSAEEYLDSL